MVEFIREGNIIEADVEALVNTVNTEGVMGAGIALQFKKAFKENFKEYEKAAKENRIEVGSIFVTETGKFTNPKYIINFPTKKHWRYPSKLEWIEEGLIKLRNFVIHNKIKSLAIPPLGCGNGKLDWNDVKPLILDAVKDIVDINVIIFEPSDFAYQKTSKKTVTKKPKLTSVRSMVLALLNRYKILGYELTLLEAQKLSYFLQRFGEPLNLDFEKGKYGPYSQKLVHVLHDMDGHYLKGMKQKTAKPLDKISVTENELDNVHDFIEKNCTNEQKERLKEVYNLIEGFESPLGMELLATVDFIYKDNPEVSSDNLQKEIFDWSERKKRLLKHDFINIALNRLKEFSSTLYSF